MKITMKDSGESPEFGPYRAGEEIDEIRASPETMQTLIDRGLAEERDQDNDDGASRKGAKAAKNGKKESP